MSSKRGFFGLSRNVFFAGLVSFFMDISSEMIYPLVPLFLANALGVNKSIIGLIEGTAESAASFLKVFSGWFSDQKGNRKYLMALGYGISTLSRPIMGTATSWQQVLVSRFTDRIGKGIRTAPRDAIIAESSRSTHLARSFSFHRSMDTMGAIVGPGLAFLLFGLFGNNYRVLFWLSMIPAGIAVLMIFIFIKEGGRSVSLRTERPKPILMHLGWKANSFVAIAALFALGNSSDVFLILRAERNGIPPAMIPMVYLLFNLVYSVSAIIAGIGADRFGRKRVVLLGFMLFAFLYYGFAVCTGTGAMWVLFAFYGLFMGLTEGVQKAFLATIIPADFKATAFGVYSSAVGFVMLPASLIAGWLWDNVSPAFTFYFGSATASLSAFSFIVLIVATRNRPGLSP